MYSFSLSTLGIGPFWNRWQDAWLLVQVPVLWPAAPHYSDLDVRELVVQLVQLDDIICIETAGVNWHQTHGQSVPVQHSAFHAATVLFGSCTRIQEKYISETFNSLRDTKWTRSAINASAWPTYQFTDIIGWYWLIADISVSAYMFCNKCRY